MIGCEYVSALALTKDRCRDPRGPFYTGRKAVGLEWVGFIGDRFMGFRNAFGKLLAANAAGVAKLAYPADSKWEICSFCPLRNSSENLESSEVNSLDALKPFAGILSNFEAF